MPIASPRSAAGFSRSSAEGKACAVPGCASPGTAGPSGQRGMEQERRNTKKPSSSEDGRSLTCTKTGGLHIGCFESTPQEALAGVDAILSQAGIAHVAEEDIRYCMWAKLMLNVSINQTCCAFGASYGDVYADEASELWRTFISAMREVVALAQAEGVALTEEALLCLCSARAYARSCLDTFHGTGPHQSPPNRSGRVLGRGPEEGREAGHPRAGERLPEQAHPGD